jgi:hypothetical protein
MSLRLGTLKKKPKANRAGSLSLTATLRILLVICIFVAAAIGLVFLDAHLKRVGPVSEKTGFLELVNAPLWINQDLKEKIYAAATAGGQNLKLDEDAARSVQSNLERQVAWLQKIRARTTHDRILVEADYRKPIALIKQGLRRFYVDAEMVVLGFVPIPDLPIVRVKGLGPIMRIPREGEVWQQDDLAAAVAILTRLDRMDQLVTPDKPLLYEIDNINVSNFRGRQSNRAPHIILYAKDNTEIIWGAEIGAWSQHLEAKDEQKLARLYNYYKQCGSLLGGARYINLRDPVGNIPLPVDRY